MLRHILATTVALVAALTPRLVLASSGTCYPPDHVGGLVGPRDGAVEVATDTLIWFGYVWGSAFQGDGHELLLVGPGGEFVELADATTLTVPHGPVFVRRPVAPLKPDTDYELWECDRTTCDVLIAGFRTGTGPHAGAPAVPQFRGEHPDGDGSGRGYFDMDIDFTGVLVVDHTDGNFDGPGLAGQAVTFSADSSNSVEIRHGECGNWIESRTKATLRFGAYDWSGSFSGWSDAETLEMRGCALAAPDGPLVLVLFAFVRRRQRPREAL